MEPAQKLVWVDEGDEEWALEVELRLALGSHRIPAGLAEEVVAEVHRSVTDTGRRAHDLFGAPEDYARGVATERVDDVFRAQPDIFGMTPGEGVSTTLGLLGAVGVLLSVMHWFRQGLWMEPSWASIAGWATVLISVALALAAPAAWSLGRIRAVWGLAAGAAGAMAAGSAVASVVPGEPLFALPAPVAVVACLSLIPAASALPKATIDRWASPTVPDGDDARWLGRLEGLLRGRHAVPAAEARGHVREAHRHLALCGTSAHTAFGPVEVYALHLAEGPVHQGRLARRDMYRDAFVSVLFALVFIDDMRDSSPSSWWFWCCVLAATYLICSTAHQCYRTLRTHPHNGDEHAPEHDT